MKAQTDDVPIPQRRKELAEHAQLRQIIEIQEINEDIPIPKRKKSVERKPEKEVKNEIRDRKNVESKDNELIITEIIDSIREKVTKCWSIPEGIVYKENFSIKINLLFSSKGEIVVADVVDSSSYQDNPLFRSAADNAMRALYRCSPLVSLPAEHHHIWREVTLNFILNR